MTGCTKYIGMDVHKESISIAVRNAADKIVMECVIERRASMILQFVDGLGGDVHDLIKAWITYRGKHVRKPRRRA
jgi:hypothetical protein